MTHTINIKCPNCKTNIEIVLDDNFNVVNINHKCGQKSNYKYKNIEFGAEENNI